MLNYLALAGDAVAALQFVDRGQQHDVCRTEPSPARCLRLARSNKDATGYISHLANVALDNGAEKHRQQSFSEAMAVVQHSPTVEFRSDTAGASSWPR